MEQEATYDTHMMPSDPDFDIIQYYQSLLCVLRNPEMNQQVIIDIDPLLIQETIDGIEELMDEIMRSRDVLNQAGLGGLR